MRNKRIKNLIIDFGGVLVDLDRHRCIDNFKKLGFENIEKLLNNYHQQGVFLNQEKGLATSAEFHDELRNIIGKPVTDEQLDAAWNSFLISIPTHKLELLLELRQEYAVYLLSNTNEIHWQWSCENVFPYRTYKVEDYFDKIYLSFEMKMVKPDPEIFQAVIKDTGIDPKETLFIDDSGINCRTAQEMGISTYTPEAYEDWSHLFRQE